MNTLEKLQSIGLTPDNSIVIGSGILSALGIRESNDIDLVVSDDDYSRLGSSGDFTKSETHGREILVQDEFEVGSSWGVLGKDQKYDDLLPESAVIEGVRYISLELLLQVKETWLREDDNARQKDVDDVRLMQAYLADQTK